VDDQAPSASPPPELHLHRCLWEARWCTDAGRQSEGAGTLEIEASSAAEALQRARARIIERLGGKRRKIEMRVAVEGGSWGYWLPSFPTHPPTVPPVGDLRAWWHEGLRSAAILRRLRDRSPSPTPLDLMLAIHFAFLPRVEELDIVAAWAGDRCSDADVAAALDPAILARFPDWDRPRRLRQAWLDRRLATAMRDERTAGCARSALHEALAEAFGIDRVAAQVLPHHAGPEDGRALALVAWLQAGRDITSWLDQQRDN
jgi:hypothetical protein